MIAETTRRVLQHLLLDWFTRVGRDLPWRRTRDPYQVLVAEMMLQQTQVDRVLPKYAAFLATFPSLNALAAAPPADVIRLWAGLGYNRRAVNLQRTARAIVSDYNGQFPHDVVTLQRLPGIGPYTAGAIACFAFEQDVAFMDTNIRRAIRRLLLGSDEHVVASERELLTLAAELLPLGQGWAWNQALMELGATICTARNPACQRCPLRTDCCAYTARRTADEHLFTGAITYVSPAQPRRRVAEKRVEPFVGSTRFYRGRVIEALRNHPPDTVLPLAQLGSYVKEHYTADDLPWLTTLIAGLTHDGLVETSAEGVRLPN